MFDITKNEKTLLIIEQNDDKRNLLLNFFSAKYSCEVAENMKSALKKIGEKEYAVILTAFAMPNFNGLELISYLQSVSTRTIPIFISDNEAQGNTVRAFRAGAFEVIQKPFTLK